MSWNAASFSSRRSEHVDADDDPRLFGEDFLSGLLACPSALDPRVQLHDLKVRSELPIDLKHVLRSRYGFGAGHQYVALVIIRSEPLDCFRRDCSVGPVGSNSTTFKNRIGLK